MRQSLSRVRLRARAAGYRALRDDDGFSLSELAVYIVVLGIISAIVAAVIVTLFRSEETVSAVTTSTSDAQNAVSVLQSDIRNARTFTSAPNGRSLTASVAGRASGAISWRCVTWAVTGSGSEQALTRSERADAAGVTAPVPTRLLEGVRAKGTTPSFFGGSAGLGAAGILAYSMEVATVKDGVIDVSGSVRNTAQGAGATSTCS